MAEDHPKINQRFNAPVKGVAGRVEGDQINVDGDFIVHNNTPPSSTPDPNSLQAKFANVIAKEVQTRLNQAFHYNIQANPPLQDESDRPLQSCPAESVSY